MSLCPDITPSSSAAMPEQSADVSSTPLHAHAVSWVSTSSTTCRMYSTGQPLCLPVHAPKHTETSSQIDGRKNSRANHPAFFILMTRNRGDAYTKSRFLCAFAGGWSPTCGRRLRKEGRHTGHEARDTGQGPEMKARCQNCGHDARDAAGWGEIRRLRQCRSLACTCVVLE